MSATKTQAQLTTLAALLRSSATEGGLLEEIDRMGFAALDIHASFNALIAMLIRVSSGLSGDAKRDVDAFKTRWDNTYAVSRSSHRHFKSASSNDGTLRPIKRSFLCLSKSLGRGRL